MDNPRAPAAPVGSTKDSQSPAERRHAVDPYERDLLEFLNHGRAARFGPIDPDTPLLQSGIIDSLFMQEIIAFVEDRYELLLPPEEIRPETFGTAGQMAGLLRRCHLRGAGRSGFGAFEAINCLMESHGLRRQWVALRRGQQHLLRCDGPGPPLVLLSGLGSPASSFGVLMRTLAGSRCALAPDLAGFGVSEANRDGAVSFQSHVENTIELLDATLEEAGVIVGSSAGAMIAAELARRRPDLCRALVVISFGRVVDGERWWRDLQSLSDRPEAFWERAFYNPPPFTAGIRRQVAQTLASEAYRGFLDAAALAALPGILDGLDLPALFVGGLEDRIVPAEMVEAGARRIPGARLEWLARCGHYAQSERAEELLVYIEHFLKEYGLTAAGGLGPAGTRS